jgi:pyruvate ferredoxin oxidoreductase alpha subunit
VAVVEGVDRPYASGGPLCTELKAAFADALTWAPDYPGIGRIPRILSGIMNLAGTDRGPLDSARVDAIVEYLHAGERGERTFLVGRDHGTAELHSRPQEGGRGALSG